ncbi:hypothetical protein BC939DRAFT_480032 [Gamsiella multidivaricata]|uniref:uncharacterized protein n=1 Tax=Gamsiella multidivaricata TaxID=101098 RepID=UPI00221EB4DA|nr:uncharacterized protein BC939DRAFT_480032 [Gamsiella multidivaricata]KAI7818855.1 hypothetical protein BC939DRAFT_480032 [Gamsiella multidivaricata]
MTKERERYVELRKKYIRAVGSDNGPEPDLEVNNPLSLAEDSPWQQFFVDSELRKIIKQDVERTLPDNDYFRSEKVQEQLNDILFIYCKINHDVSYRQGMHELVAHILWVVSSESLDVNAEPGVSSDSTLDVMKSVLDSSYIEHDTFALFSSLMRHAKPWYEFSDERTSSRRPKPTSASHTQPFGKQETPEPPPGKQTPVIEWSMNIFRYLERVDNQLYLHLKSLDIQPQLFGIRWFRLLFGREFPMDDALSLWDGIFAKDPSLKICIFIGLAMLLRIRDELLEEEDFAVCLHKLMRYPPVKDVQLFIPQAVTLQKDPNSSGGLEIIRQNSALSGKPLPPLPSPGSEAEHGTQYQNQSQQHPRDGSPSPYSRQQQYSQQGQQYDRTKNQILGFSSNGVLSQHLPPAALDAIKPVAEGFVHVTKNVLESKGGAALNKAIHDMKKNTQSYIRKANTPTPPPLAANFPPMFDQAISSSSRVVASTQPAPVTHKNQSSNNTAIDPDKQVQLQLGQIVAKALVILESEYISPSNNNDSSKSKEHMSSNGKSPSKAASAAFSGLEHVRDILLGLSKDLDPLVIESGMLEKSGQVSSDAGTRDTTQSTAKPAHFAPKPSLDPQNAGTPPQRKPPNATIATTKSNSPSPVRIGSPVRSTHDGTNEGRAQSRASSQTSEVQGHSGHEYGVDIHTSSVTPPISEPYVPTPVPRIPTPKPFSFDDLIEDTKTKPARSSSPSLSDSRGTGSSTSTSKVKSPRSSLANSQFSWMLNDDGGISSATGASAVGGIHSSSSSSLSSINKPGAGSEAGAVGGGGSGSRPSVDIFLPSSSKSRMKIDPLAGAVSKRSGSGSSVTESGMVSVASQQLSEDDPLRTK